MKSTPVQEPRPAATRRYAISVMFRDQVGIVADVASAIQRLQGNLLDVSQSVLQNYFSMILLVDFHQETREEQILQALRSLASLQGASFGILACPEAVEDAVPVSREDTYVLTASGPDRPGMVASLSAYLKERNINIVDLSSRSHEGIYTMIWQIQIPPALDVQKLQRSMQLAFQPHMEIGLRHDALFRVTNEI
ncbi:MAG: glycine cleavage system protein R [Oligosphaeraceae bacterium]